VNPSGKLPMTFPADDTQGVARTPAEYPGVDGAVHYDEGIFVGYRFYDQFGQQPVFPFGHGLPAPVRAGYPRPARRARGGPAPVRHVPGLRRGVRLPTQLPGDRHGHQTLKGFAKVFLARAAQACADDAPSADRRGNDGPAVARTTHCVSGRRRGRCRCQRASSSLATGSGRAPARAPSRA
jgi:hypothetical protein